MQCMVDLYSVRWDYWYDSGARISCSLILYILVYLFSDKHRLNNHLECAAKTAWIGMVQ